LCFELVLVELVASIEQVALSLQKEILVVVNFGLAPPFLVNLFLQVVMNFV
jgi:hypothetical protein